MTYMERVLDAVHDDELQRFRMTLKGRSTETKLRMLRAYWLGSHPSKPSAVKYEIVTCVYCIRVDNYLKALCRGGQLESGMGLEKVAALNWDVPIRR